MARGGTSSSKLLYLISVCYKWYTAECWNDPCAWFLMGLEDCPEAPALLEKAALTLQWWLSSLSIFRLLCPPGATVGAECACPGHAATVHCKQSWGLGFLGPPAVLQFWELWSVGSLAGAPKTDDEILFKSKLSLIECNYCIFFRMLSIHFAYGEMSFLENNQQSGRMEELCSPAFIFGCQHLL